MLQSGVFRFLIQLLLSLFNAAIGGLKFVFRVLHGLLSSFGGFLRLSKLVTGRFLLLLAECLSLFFRVFLLGVPGGGVGEGGLIFCGCHLVLAFIQQCGSLLEGLLCICGCLLQFRQQLFFSGTGSLRGGSIQLLLGFSKFCLSFRRFALRGGLDCLCDEHRGELRRLGANLPQVLRQFPFTFLEFGICSLVGLLQTLVFSCGVLQQAFSIGQ